MLFFLLEFISSILWAKRPQESRNYILNIVFVLWSLLFDKSTPLLRCSLYVFLIIHVLDKGFWFPGTIAIDMTRKMHNKRATLKRNPVRLWSDISFIVTDIWITYSRRNLNRSYIIKSKRRWILCRKWTCLGLRWIHAFFIRNFGLVSAVLVCTQTRYIRLISNSLP